MPPGSPVRHPGFDLIGPADWPLLKQYGLTPSMYPLGPGGTIQEALNRRENHEQLEQSLRAAIDESAASGVPNVITFSGNRNGMADQAGADNCVAFLNRIKSHAEDRGVTICMEYLNSKVNHKDYMFDHSNPLRPEGNRCSAKIDASRGKGEDGGGQVIRGPGCGETIEFGNR